MPGSPEILYKVSLRSAEQHLVHVTLNIPAGPSEHDLQMPVWNALYQVRDFSQYIRWVHATGASGQSLSLNPVTKSRWHLNGAESGAQIEYEVVANRAGPYNAQLNPQHAFFNLAEILMYPVDLRASPMKVQFTDIPSSWKIATALPVRDNELSASNYDLLVDSPVEIGTFREQDFEQGGARYRIVVDADPADYDMVKLTATVKNIVTAATAWMNDRPFEEYTFLYHFPRSPSGGGMEHSYSTAIDVNASILSENYQALFDVTAHEFFHLWNVKRIRPQPLQPVDYTQENYTKALWFSEGVTSTVEDYIGLQTGALDESSYLLRLAGAIGELQNRSAHRTQSAEEASLNAWLEKYPDYKFPVRSISYYNKGDLLGVLLDLTVRDASHGTASLRDVFQWMNRNYAQKGEYFADSDGVRQAAEAVCHTDLSGFFQKYVAGTEEIPWDDFFKSVGLRLAGHTNKTSDAGFLTARNADSPIVSWLDPEGEAADAGLLAGDTILEINGHPPAADFQEQLSRVQAGSKIHLRVRRGATEQQISWKMDTREEFSFEFKDVKHISAEQKARRAAWLSGIDQNVAGAQP